MSIHSNNCFSRDEIWLMALAATAATILISALAVSLSGRYRKANLWVGWVMERLELCHLLYIRSRRPTRIILMRHAESEGNVNKEVYTSTPDHALRITDRGRRQAAEAGHRLKELIGEESVYFMVSPYTRTRMTYDIVRETLNPKEWATKEDPRLRELDFGNFQDLATMKETMEIRKAYGRFWFRFMNGESGADVYDRATAFWESVFRSMDNTTSDIRFRNYVIVTHGLMMRLILMRYFQWKVEYFERVWNPDNCETWVMERDERGGFRLETEILNRPSWSCSDDTGPDSPGGTNVSDDCEGNTTPAAVLAATGPESKKSNRGRKVFKEGEALKAGNRETFIQQIDNESVEGSSRDSRKNSASSPDANGNVEEEEDGSNSVVSDPKDLDSDEPATPPLSVCKTAISSVATAGQEEFIVEEDTAEAAVM